ncbi:MAG: cupredoxin domain-containing protein [Opitutales bacterium]
MRKSTATFAAVFCLVLLALGSGCGSANVQPAIDSGEPVDREYVLKGLIHGYYGLGGAIDGVKNPVLTAREGESVRIVLINGERMPHDVALRAHGVRSPEILNKDERTSVTFTAQSDDTYYCTIPGHVQTGMSGEFRILTDPLPATTHLSSSTE